MINKDIKCFRVAYSEGIDDINTQGYSFPCGRMINAATVYEPITTKQFASGPHAYTWSDGYLENIDFTNIYIIYGRKPRSLQLLG